MAEITLNKDNFRNEVLDQSGYVLVDFWASWCGPCKMVAPILHEIAEENADIKVGKVDVDSETDLAQEYRIYSIPTLLLFKDGKIVNRQIGYMPKNQIIQMFQK